ncbi:8449_t:CDS:2, partial [Racocetra persica]
FNENDDPIKMNKKKIDNLPMDEKAYSDEIVENEAMINLDSLEKNLKEDIS